MPEDKHWLVRPDMIRLLWWIGSVVLALTVVAAIFVDLHPYFPVERIFAFYALFGFFACVAMVLFAKLLGVFLKRPDTYYDE